MKTIRTRLQLLVGIAAAVTVLVVAIQTGDFGAMREKTMLIKSLVHWNDTKQ